MRITHTLLLWLKEGSCDKGRSPIFTNILAKKTQEKPSGSFDVRVLDGAAVVQPPPSDWHHTFDDYASGVFVPHIMRQLETSMRVDVVWDRRKQVFATSGASVVCSGTDHSMPPCDHEEADTRIVVHLQDALESGCNHMFWYAPWIRDVLVILIGKYHFLASKYPSADIWVAFGSWQKLPFLHINPPSVVLGAKRSPQRYQCSNSFTGPLLQHTKRAVYQAGIGQPVTRPNNRHQLLKAGGWTWMQKQSPGFLSGARSLRQQRLPAGNQACRDHWHRDPVTSPKKTQLLKGCGLGLDAKQVLGSCLELEPAGPKRVAPMDGQAIYPVKIISCMTTGDEQAELAGIRRVAFFVTMVLWKYWNKA
ncbi:hypothetical protein GWK47_044147 [Chionoecetes opilio]|uniref:Uncharacterized protein n=1 Tax=Chionoecetes opilio TaxID=41210 RepID=A0A8J5CVT9_CHIOP|nr:hypothetical protein GWK47_044147 [Chionoecetes opilio]